ncbi:caspase-7 isoform X2 [Culex pipiens pallens]|uniref:caspase-7 isoform X2 n=1 Tax=Culex pipiens pallens TaxID=42434 RepID=UPI001954B972|nr:caspase-7 isoform X2 [Culex pipiens pallens]
MYNKGTKSTFSSSSQQYSSFRSATATSSSTTSRTVTSGGVLSSTVNSSSNSSTQHQSAFRRSSATAICNSPTAITRNERPYNSVRGPLGQSYSGSVTGAAIGALGGYGSNRLERSTSSINRPLALPSSTSVTTGRPPLSPLPQKTTWDAKPYPGSSFSSGNSGTAAASSVRPSSSYSSPSTSSGIVRSPFGSTSSTASSVERYNLRDQKGYVLIFHHKHFKNAKAIREGSEKDLQLLKHFFTRYRVKKPDICENYTVLRIKDKMRKIAEKDFSKYSCLLVIVMSHGETKDRIQAYDNLYNFEQEVVERVLTNTTLKDKPKLFFIQACKGSATMQHDVTSVATNKNDMLKCYSTYEGTVSLRDPRLGTYFIQTLFTLIDEQGDKDVADLMILTRKRFKDDKVPQAPTDTSTLTKKFYFRDLK